MHKETRSILTHEFTPEEVHERRNWPEASRSTAGGKIEPFVPVTDKELTQYRALLIGNINKQIIDLKECGALKNAKGISDGYHTFGELYETRAVLNIALFRRIKNTAYTSYLHAQHTQRNLQFSNPVWRSKLHSDGSMFDGMFILGLGTEPGMQITFHYHLDKWDDCSFAETLEQAPEFDGHTPAEALERIKAL